MKYKKSRVVRLSTEGVSNIVKRKSDSGLLFLRGPIQSNPAFEAQHIYLLSNERLPYDSEIFNKGVFFHIDAAGKPHVITKDTFKPNPNFCRRIIASTDLSLNVAKLPDAFLQKYCKLQGISEVTVAYEKDESVPLIFDGVCDFVKPYKLKIQSDGTVAINLIKDTWTSEEVVSILKEFNEDVRIHPVNDVDLWIEEKLWSRL